MNQVADIVADLGLEERKRRLRSIGLLAGLLALVAAFPAANGLRPLSIGTLAVVVNGLVLLIVVGVPSSRSSIRVSGEGAFALTMFGTLLPLLAAETFSGHAEPLAAGAAECFVSTLAVGFVALLAIRVGLGSVRRRFGGVLQMQGTAAALVATLSIGLHCPHVSVLHLSSHVAAFAAVCLLSQLRS